MADTTNKITLSPSNIVVFETLLSEAVDNVFIRVKSGEKFKEAFENVSKDMSLNEFETDEMIGRVKKQVNNLKEKPPEPVKETSDATIRPMSIYFENSEQAKGALDALMQRGIPWSSQLIEDAKPFIQFKDENGLQEAQSALRRKYDFVENRKRLVADIQFDNLSDYKRVLEFMRRTGTLLEFEQEGIELDEDYDELQNEKMVQQKIADKEGRLVEDTVEPELRSYQAKTKDSRATRIDPLKESKYRVARARKRWY